MPSSRLHEGMTRTQSPSRRVSTGRRAAMLASLAVLLLLVLVWAIFSTSVGPGSREARAQNPDPSDEPEKAAQGDDSLDPGSGGGEEYAAYNYKDPFTRVVPLAGQEGDLGDNNGGSGGENGDDRGNVNSDGSTGGEDSGKAKNPSSQNHGTQMDRDEAGSMGDSEQSGTDMLPESGNGSSASAGSSSSGVGGSGSGLDSAEESNLGGTGEGDVDCADPEDDFERLLCEEEEAGATPGGSGPAEPGGLRDEGRYGGSGRSGAGEPAETFRNGGGPPLK